MRISPCGWFCIEEPSGWTCTDTPEAILLKHPASGASIEITSARNENRVRESEMWDLLERMLEPMEHAPFEETSMFRLESGVECLRSIHGDETRLLGIALVFWGNYCVQIRLVAEVGASRQEDCMLSLNSLLDSLQPLTLE